MGAVSTLLAAPFEGWPAWLYAEEPHTPGPLPDKPGYSGTQAARIVGASYRQIDYWLSSGLIDTECDADPGSGYQRVLTLDELTLLRVAVAMLEGGVSLQKVRQLIGDVDPSAEAVTWTDSPALSTTLDIKACRSYVQQHAAGVEPVWVGREAAAA